MNKFIDLRSDTVTLPTRRMREATVCAKLGDDGYEEDSTVVRLQELSARRAGKEAALLVPSGTMGNLISILAHTGVNDSVILGDLAHIYLWESEGVIGFGGRQLVTIPTRPGGMIDIAALQHTIQSIYGLSRPGLICMENTHNRCGGTVLRREQIEQVVSIAAEFAIPAHLDGARIFNAAAALEVDVSELTTPFDSVMFCFSKALAAPIGSVICGSAEFVREARKLRTILGGQMRQAGFVAAAAIVALETMVDRLPDDHLTARALAEGIAEMPEFEVPLGRVQTNIVMFKPVDQGISLSEFLDEMWVRGVRLLHIGDGWIRAVTHYGIVADDIQRTLSTIRMAVQALKQRGSRRLT